MTETTKTGSGCCDKTDLKMDWNYGVCADGDHDVIALGAIECKNCGMTWYFSPSHGAECPLMEVSDDENQVVLSIRRHHSSTRH